MPVKHRIHWDHYFVQWCKHWLPTLGLDVEGKPQFSQLPLEADMMVITTHPTGEWLQHPIWRHLSPYTVVEFKSIHDPFQAIDFGKLMAYVGLTMEKEKLPPEVEIGGWLVVPYINRQLHKVLRLKRLKLEQIQPGIHHAHTGLFPLLVVEYNHLPNEPMFVEFKTFMKRGTELRKSMLMALRKWQDSKLYEEYTTIITNIHSEEANAVIEVLESDKPKMKHMAKLLLEKLGDDAADLEFARQKELKGELKNKLKTACRMKQRNFDIDTIADLTGLDKKTIDEL